MPSIRLQHKIVTKQLLGFGVMHYVLQSFLLKPYSRGVARRI